MVELKTQSLALGHEQATVDWVDRGFWPCGP